MTPVVYRRFLELQAQAIRQMARSSRPEYLVAARVMLTHMPEICPSVGSAADVDG